MKTFFSALILIGIIFLTNSALAQDKSDKKTTAEFHAQFCKKAQNDSLIVRPDSMGFNLYYFPCNGTRFQQSYKAWYEKNKDNFIAHLQPNLVNLEMYEDGNIADHMLGIKGWYVMLEPLTHSFRH